VTWNPDFETVVQISQREYQLYTQRQSTVLRSYQHPERKGIHKAGEFPVAVVRRLYDALGYGSWFSGQSRHGADTYLLTRLPGKRRQGDAAYKRIVKVFGQARVDAINQAAIAERKALRFKAAGGDPDLFVYHRADPTLRFFVEVKLENLAKSPPYLDRLGDQQKMLFPLIQTHLGCGVRLARVQITKAG